LVALLEPVNGSLVGPNLDFAFGTFVRRVYFPFYRRKWKPSTAGSNENRIDHHLTKRFEDRCLTSFSRDELQTFLDQKAARGVSYSVVAHLRWDLRQVFRMAVTEGNLPRNPAELLFVPREARRPAAPRMTLEQVNLALSVLDLRERVIAGLAILAGMRPGEIFALRRCHVENGYADIQQRIYRGLIDTPKTANSVRWAGLGDGQTGWLREWLDRLSWTDPDTWVLPSEKGSTPLIKDNCWRRFFRPRLKTAGLEWANFQVVRRTHSCSPGRPGRRSPGARRSDGTLGGRESEHVHAFIARPAAVNLLEKAVGVA
jgi:integrase